VVSFQSAFQALFVDDLDLDIHLSFHLTMDYEIGSIKGWSNGSY
jgi:hypothetical protein